MDQSGTNATACSPTANSRQQASRILRPGGHITPSVFAMLLPTTVNQSADPGLIHRRSAQEVNNCSGSILLVCDREQLKRHQNFLEQASISVTVVDRHAPPRQNKGARFAELITYSDLFWQFGSGRQVNHELVILDETSHKLSQQTIDTCLRLARIGVKKVLSFNSQQQQVESENEKFMASLGGLH